MAENMDSMAETLIIPRGSHERFLVFDAVGGRELFNRGVRLAGVSRLVDGYKVVRLCPDFHVAIFLTGGCCAWGAGEERGELAAGDFAFLPAGRLQYYAARGKFEMIWFHLSAADPEWRFLAAAGPLRHPAECRVEVELLAELLARESARLPLPDADAARPACLALLRYLQHELRHAPAEDRIGRRLDRVFAAVARHPERHWPVAELAKLAGLSESHFFALVRGRHQCSPHQLVAAIRLRAARNLLANSTYKLDTIAELVGFSSGFVLSRAFKRECGLSPGAFRMNPAAQQDGGKEK